MLNGSFSIENYINTMNCDSTLGLNICGAFRNEKTTVISDAITLITMPEKPSDLKLIGDTDR